nr:putative capsid protein [Crucivirus sp.]
MPKQLKCPECGYARSNCQCGNYSNKRVPNMPKATRTRSQARAKGYHYAKRRDGTKYRVYGAHKTRRGSSGGSRYPRSTTTRKTPRRGYGRKDSFGDTIMGVGAYRRRRGGSKILGGNPPTVQNASGGFIVRHREYIGDLNTSQAFTNFAFPLNPGIQATFPWLAEVAANFEEWVPRGIVFEFKSTSSDAVVSTNANAALGTVIMATEYNPYNGAFANKQQMENYEWAKSCKPSQSMLHGVECSRKQNPMPSYFVRTQAVPTSQDIRLYDLGVFQIAAVGMQSNGAACGELWCSYEIELRKPRIQVGVGGEDDGNSNFDHIVITNATLATAGVLPATPFGTSSTVPLYPTTQSTLGGVVSGGACTAASFTPQTNTPTKNNFVGGVAAVVPLAPIALPGAQVVSPPTGTLGAAAANTYYFPPGVSGGNFMIQYNALYGTGGANWTPVQAMTNCQALNLISTNTINFQANLSSVTSVSCTATFFVKVIGANAAIAFPGSTGAYMTPTYAELFVVQIPNPVN